ncbi:acetyl-CoA carboxylase biotin carboxyl carrier protein [Paenibacillus cisolokensis]|jgi:acetyl-CoA carboxylase biotin carboxyl carrier protein|uniref:Biotin carboxyl carrier protein of acetyl-CoA carboxylase n=1 Tax=Paenibacillus cisolokensis TaxID=1658519 RepID=A0ABQ4NCG1_9BACL|nr:MULTISPECIES: acetyl-CoA carboxylase biotin carboxyl carrier protein [Paenibacillus]ALS28405.1 acetyl-CoA carboxylase [Paenibacillus sp. 32O-W]GIQ65909.1 acetyl-CoA carboxylase, biotin carboxyl carrier protein [Paenibacillus cisolokensis]
MFKLSEIKELIKLLDQTSVQELEIENDGARLLIRKPGKTEVVNVHTPQIAPAYAVPAAPQAAPSAPAAQPEPAKPADAGTGSDAGLHRIVSPMVGTFYRAPSPDAPPFVNVGDRVTEKTVVCILEAMKLMNELEAEVRGEIVEILVENGQLVEFGQPLFLVKPE